MATPFTFGNPLKFSSDSCHNAKGRPTFLHREREKAPEALCEAHIAHQISRGALQWGPTRAGAVAMAGGRTKAVVFPPFSDRGWALTNWRLRWGSMRV